MATHFGNAAPFKTPANFNDKRILHQCDCEQLRTEVLSLNLVLKLEKDCKDSVESQLNREMCFREAVDVRFNKMEEYVKEAMAALEKEVVECFRRRDKQWTKQLKEKKLPEATVPTPTETSNPVPSTIYTSSPPTDCSTISTLSQTDSTTEQGISCTNTSSGPDVSYIFSVLPFSSEEANSTQQDDYTLAIISSTPQTDRITVINHQGLLYRQIQCKGGQYRLQLVVPKALIERTLRSLHERTTERHHGRLKTLLSVLEVAWWPTVRKDVWRYVGDCGVCNVNGKIKEPSRHPASSSSPTIKQGRRNARGERRAGKAGYSMHQGYPGWYRLPPLCNGSPVPFSQLVPAWECLVLANLFQRHFKSHFKEDTHFMDYG
ncbi:uncharacterized protein [Chanodichthys erythropterus]|uniref:uncharacterized protein n=1 Tax=Chanodichthys erythropterus TaxID=933992 RepID=UPI00351EC095